MEKVPTDDEDRPLQVCGCWPTAAVGLACCFFSTEMVLCWRAAGGWAEGHALQRTDWPHVSGPASCSFRGSCLFAGGRDRGCNCAWQRLPFPLYGSAIDLLFC